MCSQDHQYNRLEQQIKKQISRHHQTQLSINDHHQSQAHQTMFRSRQKQQKVKVNSNSLKINATQAYYQNIKSKHFEIYLNSGVNQYDNFDTYSYVSTFKTNCFQHMIDNLVRNFSSIYTLDYKAFEWKEKLEGFLKMAKEIIKIIDQLKHELKEINQTKTNIQHILNQNHQLKQENQKLKHKITQIEALNKDKQIVQPKKNSINHNQFVQKSSQTQQKMDIHLHKMQQQNIRLINQNTLLRKDCIKLVSQNNEFKKYLNKIKNSCFSQGTIESLLGREVVCFKNKEEMIGNQISLQKDILLDQKLCSLLISFLPPKSITSLSSLSKLSRFFLLHSSSTVFSTFRSIIRHKNVQIKYLHRHIDHFQKLLKKIPQQIIQSTFYQYNILKQQIGGDFLSVLNLCGDIFEGKISPVNNQLGSRTIKEYIESKEILHHVELPKQEEFYLQVDHELIIQFFEQRKARKQLIMKQIEQIGSKISITESLFTVDEVTLRQFYQTVIKHFSVLFVLSKYLFAESRNLQHLNTFLLGRLNQLDKFKIEKEYDLEDVRTQLQSAAKMNLFLSDKYKKSEEKVLRQNKQQLQLTQEIAKLNLKLKEQISLTQQLQTDFKSMETQNTKLAQRNKQIKALYSLSKDKYNRLLNELSAVKETISKIT